MIAAFAVSFMVGATALAVWFDLRFPRLRPAGWRGLGVATLAVMAADDVCVGLIHEVPRLLGVMGVGLPLMAGTMLVSLWMLRVVREAMPG
jgi:hypothetical protein